MQTQAVWEAEELKAQLLETESRLSEVEARAEKDATQRAEAERQLQAERKLTAQLQVSPLSPKNCSSSLPSHRAVNTFLEGSMRYKGRWLYGSCYQFSFG